MDQVCQWVCWRYCSKLRQGLGLNVLPWWVVRFEMACCIGFILIPGEVCLILIWWWRVQLKNRVRARAIELGQELGLP